MLKPHVELLTRGTKVGIVLQILAALLCLVAVPLPKEKLTSPFPFATYSASLGSILLFAGFILQCVSAGSYWRH